MLSIPSALYALLSIDVTEVQIFIIIMYLLAAIGGSAFWQSPVILRSFLLTLTCFKKICFNFFLES